MKDTFIYIFVGTAAELIKLIPIIIELRNQNIPFQIIASGQNDVRNSDLWKFTDKVTIDLVLSDKPIKQTAFSLFCWFCKTLVFSLGKIRAHIPKNTRQKSILLVHGDTISTLMGAILARLSGMKTAHVEAGLRSFNLLRPFPEELCRIMVSKIADLAFCPNDWARENLAKHPKVKTINTMENTLLDSLKLALSKPRDENFLSPLPPKYFIAVIHRQENLFDRNLLKRLLSELAELSNYLPCVFVIHRPSQVVLEQTGLIDLIKDNSKIIKVSRLPYVTFTHLLKGAEFIITDGGSNQEESYYLGKPCLILRRETERNEGLGRNAVLSNLEQGAIMDFFKNLEKYRHPPVNMANSPSKTIVDFIKETI